MITEARELEITDQTTVHELAELAGYPAPMDARVCIAEKPGARRPDSYVIPVVLRVSWTDNK